MLSPIQAYRICSSLQSYMITPFTTPIFIQVMAKGMSEYILEQIRASTQRRRKYLDIFPR